jgi:type II secretory pathway pseudopilin PulG
LQIKLRGFRKKAFSTLEIVIFIVVIATILSFLLPKFDTFFEKSDLLKLKSDIALINNGIQKEKSKNILIQKYGNINKLDGANIDS